MISKKHILFLLCLLLLISLFGCGDKQPADNKVKLIHKDGVEYAIDMESCTIQDGSYIYSYVANSSGTTINYPNGESYTWKESNGIGIGSTSANFDYDSYVDPWILMDVIDEAYADEVVTVKTSHKNAGYGVLLLIVGIGYTVWSDKVWFLNWGWRYKNAEPSDLSIGLYKVGGIAAIIAGAIMIIL